MIDTKKLLDRLSERLEIAKLKYESENEPADLCARHVHRMVLIELIDAIEGALTGEPADREPTN